MLANLDNGTIFKKAFTNREVFEHFVKDVLGFEVKVGKIETEKKFEPRIGHISFELDIFAETLDKRVVIELQKVEYDYNFDRFWHYFSMLIVEQQSNSRAYAIDKTVYLILIMTEPYKVIKDITGRKLDQEMIVITIHAEDSGKSLVPLYPHKFIALNPNHRHPDTPKAIRDWLDLVYESVNNPKSPKLNHLHKGVMKAADLIEYEKLSPEENEAKKKDESAKDKRALYEQAILEEGEAKGREEGEAKGRKAERKQNIKLLHSNGIPLELLANTFKLTVLEVQQIIEEQ